MSHNFTMFSVVYRMRHVPNLIEKNAKKILSLKSIVKLYEFINYKILIKNTLNLNDLSKLLTVRLLAHSKERKKFEKI